MEILFKWAMGISIFFATLQMLTETSQVDCEVDNITCTKPGFKKGTAFDDKKIVNAQGDSLNVHPNRTIR